MAAGTYTFRNVSYPGAYATELTGINNLCEVTGSYAPVAAAVAAQTGFTESAGSFTQIVLPNTRPRDYTGGINNAGKVALTAGGGTTKPEGVLWSPDGSFTTIDPTNETVHTYGVNDAGTVVGSIRQYFGSGPMSAFVDSNGVLSTFQVDGLDTEAHGINNAGDIVGQTIGTAGAPGSGFIDRGGAITHISGDPMAINNLGTVAGSIYDGTHWHGFIDDSQGHMTFIDAPGAVDTFVTGINDHGDLSGYCDTQSFGATTGFIALDPPARIGAGYDLLTQHETFGMPKHLFHSHH
jgi:hypothetical protein